MSFVKVVLMAVIAAALHLAYVALPIFIGLPGFLSSRSFGNFGNLLISLLTSLATVTFLVVLWRDCSGLPSALSLRNAGLIAAVTRSISIVSFIHLYHIITFTFTFRFLIPSIVWVAFFLTFFILPAPLYASLTRALAGILAVFSGVNAVMSVYDMRNLGAYAGKGATSPWDAMRMPVGFAIAMISALCIGFLLAMIARGQEPAKSNTVESL
jgi:hypothetical protein